MQVSARARRLREKGVDGRAGYKDRSLRRGKAMTTLALALKPPTAPEKEGRAEGYRLRKDDTRRNKGGNTRSTAADLSRLWLFGEHERRVSVKFKESMANSRAHGGWK